MAACCMAALHLSAKAAANAMPAIVIHVVRGIRVASPVTMPAMSARAMGRRGSMG